MFKIDAKVKKVAQKKAKLLGIALSDFLQSATRDFATGRFTMGIQENWNSKAKRSLLKSYSSADAIYDSI
ncbi:hypothetical protein A3I95_03120 [Candidatus Nomurabacteria bacterium RIFCSPLOWO2_02_FULL_44_12]|nr:MAG: hypothetical protein A3I95_03120 [Candidatus Nomurabacteria bacterium RIFCSPLOWO2_02_FULL_44_12]